MKKLELMEDAYRMASSGDFGSVCIITCHHVIEADYILMNYLKKCGLDMGNVFVIGKNYSTNKKTFDKYSKMGIHIDKSSLMLNRGQSFDEYFRVNVRRFLKTVCGEIRKKKGIEKIIVYDDGGLLLEEVMKNDYDFSGIPVVGIEHTSSGYNKIKDLKFKFPVINVARSKAKLKYESPFIAVDAVSKIEKHIERLGTSVNNVLIMGGGEIGNSVRNIMIKNYPRVDVIDTDPRFSDIEDLDKSFFIKRYDLIIGATGFTSVKIEDYDNIKSGAILASVSSSDREFSAFELRAGESKEIHSDIIFKGKVILNNGFPVNFDGKEIIAPLEKIQFTMALVFYAIYQAISVYYGVNEFVQLDEKVQDYFIKKFVL